MTDIEQIRQTLARYWIYLDDRREDDWVALFDDDLVLEFDGTIVATRSDLEVVAGDLKNYPGGKHLSSNELISLAGVGLDILGWTHSCHRGSTPCGQCPGCAKRSAVLTASFPEVGDI